MRLQYASREPDPSNIEAVEVYQRIEARRWPRPLIPLDLTLLHAPPVADGYNSFIGALRTKTVIAPSLLELSICRIGHLNGAVYEWNIHGPLALNAGVSVQQLHEIATLPPFTDKRDNAQKAWKDTHLTKIQRVVLRYTDEATMSVAVSDEVFRELRQVLPSDREVVELTATIAGYNCVSRILVALHVGEHSTSRMKSVEEMAQRC
ncbi:4-carboxymuconolactone decarboxylase [Aspergillus sclerotialis]|uniref:4-carboxymuconolactone decarboxylase n=1 Tax=Aspergillus sclerotialis TaxID=2070753 RepID=A0A3A3A1W6_9EURO|nr:4-carboxymuconolactone decarboxylase [Aspergillus sclerotialis]